MRLVVLVVLVGCSYRATFGDCEVACVAGACPDGFACGGEGLCRIAGAGSGTCADVLSDAGSDATADDPDGPAGGEIITLRQTADTVIAPSAVTACGSGTGSTADNRWFRVFAVPTAFRSTRVTFAIQEASPTTRVTVRLGLYHAAVGPALDLGRVEELASGLADLPEIPNGELVDIPLAARVPAGSQLLLEVSAPDLSGSGRRVVIGATAAGQTQPGYWASEFCFSPTPATTMLDFPNKPFILEVTGTAE